MTGTTVDETAAAPAIRRPKAEHPFAGHPIAVEVAPRGAGDQGPRSPAPRS
jgi:hypothetical protein